ncbi:MAG: hypothetical protein LLF97_00915 [Planctomycetaceae bacterium]|nr:hypothetical protein [Planctomycetaceae bacterium]
MMRRCGLVLLLAIQALLAGWIGWVTCPNKTEIGHLGAAAYFWKSLRFDVFCVNPPLTRIIAGAPIVMLKPNYNWDNYSSHSRDRPEWGLGGDFLAANRPETNWRCMVLARWSLIPLLLLGGYFGWRLSREMYGEAAGFVFLALWCFSPLLLAWGATICPDAVAAAMGLVAIYVFRQWLLKPNWIRAAVAGGCLGLLPLTKLTWIVAFGIWPLIWCIWTAPIYWTKTDKRRRPLPPLRQLAAILLLGLYVLNMGYLFDGTFRPLGKYRFISQLLCGQENPSVENRFAGTRLGAIPVPLPADFVQGVDTQWYDFEQGRSSYLRGQWADHGWWYYYLYALLVKEPLATWCLAALALGTTIFVRSCSESWRDEMLVLVPFAVILVVVSSQTGFSSHSRYILPALPLLFVWISKVGQRFEARPLTKKRLAAGVAVALLLVWSVGSSLAICPHSLSYFNELAAVLPTPVDGAYPTPIGESDENILTRIIRGGPRNGPRHLLDSNIDWGQDLFYLADWYGSHPEARPIRVAYFGNYPLVESTIQSEGRPPTGLVPRPMDDDKDSTAIGPLPGWYAVSVNEIYGRSQQYRYFLNFEPYAMAGYSIYIYHITLDDANRVRKKLGLPVLSEPGVAKEDAAGGGHG